MRRVAAKAFLAEEQRVQHGYLAIRRALARQALAQDDRERIEARQIGRWVEIWVFLARDQQRGARQVDIVLVAADEHTQLAAGLVCLRHLGTPRMRDYNL